MPHPEIVNATRHAFQEMHLPDEDGAPLLVLVLRATWTWQPGRAPERVQEEPAIPLAGEPYAPLVPGGPSIPKIEPEVAFVKPSTDVLLLGTARPASRGAATGLVRLRAGAIDKSVAVFGQRRWMKGLISPSLSSPQPFEGVALRWEHAYGGPEERRNPVGTGHFPRSAPFVEGTAAPLLERPDQLLRGWRDAPAPANFGVVAPSWEPRARLAGTYGQTWTESRMPALPADFDRRALQAAPVDQISPRPFRGNELVSVEGLGERIEMRLPCTTRPIADVHLRDRRAEPDLLLDTVVIDADQRALSLTWRGHVRLARGAHDVRAIRLREAPLGA